MTLARRRYDSEINLIEPNLYLGSRAATGTDILKTRNITHIISMERTKKPLFVHLENVTVKYIVIEDEADQNILQYFDETHDFITVGQSAGNVFVHCAAGISRSATIVIAHMMKKHFLSYEDALRLVTEKRSKINPNWGFVLQLKLYEALRCNLNIDRPNAQDWLSRFVKLAQVRLRLHSKEFLSSFTHVIRPEPVELAQVRLQLHSTQFLSHFAHVIRPDPVDDQPLLEPHLRCKKCQKLLALEEHRLNRNCDNCLFMIEPMTWIGADKTIKNEIFCPGCQAPVGCYNWREDEENGQCTECYVKFAPYFTLRWHQVDIIYPK